MTRTRTRPASLLAPLSTLPHPSPPRFLPPMLAKPARRPPGGGGWAFEYKWDGVRASIRWDGRTLTLRSRLGNDITSRYPELQTLGDLLGRRAALLDGEIVAPDRRGIPSFSRLQRRMHVANPMAALIRAAPVACLVFDVLWLDDEPTTERAYALRRDILAELDLNDGPWRTPPHHETADASGAALLRSAAGVGLEGIVAKRLDSPYLPGVRSDAWRKVRVEQRQEFVIGGWTPGKGKRAGGIGALLIGYRDEDGRLRYAGKAGTGFDAEEGQRLWKLLGGLAQAPSPFADAVPDRLARFVEPALVCEVKFTEWTHDDILRHPVYQGLRGDKDPCTVVREP